MKRPHSAAYRRLLNLDGVECARHCGRPARHVDHVVPLADGGSNDAANLQPLCVQCHHAKTAREHRERGQLRRAQGKRSQRLHGPRRLIYSHLITAR